MDLRRAWVVAAVVSLLALSAPAAGAATRASTSRSTSYTTKKLTSPDRVQVSDSRGVVATFTVGARSVALRGQSRVFSEPTNTAATVTSTTWVRLLPGPFSGVVDYAWLNTALADKSPDLLAVANQYIAGSVTVHDSTGQVVSSDASYGPLQADGTRAEGSDFNDYLGVTWSYPNGTDPPEVDQYGALDCSGFVRMVLGYRSGMPMTLDPNGTALPRRAFQMLASAPGVVTIPDAGSRPSSTGPLQPGDLVFFDANAADGTQVDHVGVYLGVDNAGAPRFISSRKTADGPTLGDTGGKSVLTGTGYYASAWRAARRP